MTALVAIDVGGTHARFAVAALRPGAPPTLGTTVKLKAADFPTLGAAYHAFAAQAGGKLPPRAALAVACPVDGDLLKLTNSPWVLRTSALPAELGLERLLVLNDFGAVTHAIPRLEPDALLHLCGPDSPLPGNGPIAVVGPGTGLGVGLLLRRDGHTHVVETEGGHMDFAPVDAIEDALLVRLRQHYGRVSVERIVSGPGLAHIYEALAAHEGRPVKLSGDAELWAAASEGSDDLAARALERWCLALGCVAGNLALAHGAKAVVLAGGLPPRILPQLLSGGFEQRFRAKGRFEAMMGSIPVRVCIHPEPGLLGAAAAFEAEA
ncbi:MAG: glucokinase [Sphingomonadaceae bacterium]|nr:glucokinase [Sphingomonadaceae bacterium]